MRRISPAMYYAFPNPAPKEHLLSALLRYTRFSPSSNFPNAVKMISPDTSGMGAGRPYRKVYGDICALFDQHHPDHQLLEQHTLFRYFQPFEPFQNALKINTPRIPGGIRVQTQWRWCVACAEEDMEMYGFHSLHTDHQLPGNCLCERHQTPLTFRCLACQGAWLDLADFAGDPRLPERCPHCAGKLGGRELPDNPTVHWVRDISFGLLEGRVRIPPMYQLRAAYRRFIGLEQRPTTRTVATNRVLAEANRYVRDQIDCDAANYFFRCFASKQNSSSTRAVLPLTKAAYEEMAVLHPVIHLLLIRTIFGDINNIPMTGVGNDDHSTLSASKTICA